VLLSLYEKDGRVKVELALVHGKQEYDRRDDVKKREAQREIDGAWRAGDGRGELAVVRDPNSEQTLRPPSRTPLAPEAPRSVGFLGKDTVIDRRFTRQFLGEGWHFAASKPLTARILPTGSGSGCDVICQDLSWSGLVTQVFILAAVT
jgi:hypothetical protein